MTFTFRIITHIIRTDWNENKNKICLLDVLYSCKRMAQTTRNHLVLITDVEERQCRHFLMFDFTFLNSSVPREPVYSDQVFFSPRPAHRERYPRSQALSSKNGGGESLVTFARRAVDFWHVIIYVINEGHSYFCGKCRVSYKSVTRYWKYRSLFSRHPQLHRSLRHFYSELILWTVDPVCGDKWAGPANNPQWTARSDQWPSRTPCQLPFANHWEVLCPGAFSSESTIRALARQWR